MASRTADLLIRIQGDTSGATKALESTGKSASTWSGKLSGAAKVAGAGLVGLGALLVSGTKAAAEDQQAQVLLAQAMKNSAGATDAQIASTEDWIAKTALASGVADDDLRPALSNLVRATGDVSKAQDAMGLALDISAATGKDVQSVSVGLAKAYAGNTASLGKLVPGIDKATLASGDMTKISAELAKQVGGSSAAAAGTAAGQYQRMQVALGETQETIGGLLLPALTSLLAIFQPMLASLSQNTKLVRVLVIVFAALAATVVVVNAATKAYTAATKIAAVASRIWAAAQWLVNAALTANPIGLVVLAIVGLVAAIVIAYKKSQTFRDIVNAAFRSVLTVVQGVWNWIRSNWPLLLGVLLGPFGVAVAVIIRNFDTIKNAAQAVYDFLRGIFDKIASAVSHVSGLIKKIPHPSIPDLNPFSAAAPSRTARAAPQVAGLGRSAGTRVGGATSSSGGVNITVNGALDPESVARQIQAILGGHGRRMGQLAAI